MSILKEKLPKKDNLLIFYSINQKKAATLFIYLLIFIAIVLIMDCSFFWLREKRLQQSESLPRKHSSQIMSKQTNFYSIKQKKATELLGFSKERINEGNIMDEEIAERIIEKFENKEFRK